MISRHNAFLLCIRRKIAKGKCGVSFFDSSRRWCFGVRNGRPEEERQPGRGENKKANYLAVTYPSGWGVDMTCRETRDLRLATPGVYYKGGIKYTGCQKMKRHPTAFFLHPPIRRSSGDEVTVTYGMVAGAAVVTESALDDSSRVRGCGYLLPESLSWSSMVNYTDVFEANCISRWRPHWYTNISGQVYLCRFSDIVIWQLKMYFIK